MGITPIYSIPFADPTDLVRDWPALSEDVAEAVEAAVAGVPVLAGIGSNVVQTVKTDVFTTSSTTYETITGLTATITPSSASSKILVMTDINFGVSSDYAAMRLRRDSTDVYLGNAEGSREISFVSAYRGNTSVGSYFYSNQRWPGIFLDSPETTSSLTYSIVCRRVLGSGVVYVNRNALDGNDSSNGRVASSLTVIEVAA